MRQHKDATWWRAHLVAIEREGISTKEYGRREGLPVAQLYAWRKRIKEQGRRVAAKSLPQTQFVALQVAPASAQVSPSLPSACTLITTGGVRLELPELPNPQWLAELDIRLCQERV